MPNPATVCIMLAAETRPVEVAIICTPFRLCKEFKKALFNSLVFATGTIQSGQPQMPRTPAPPGRSECVTHE